MTKKPSDFDFESFGYSHGRILPSGERAALMPFIFTTGLVCGIDDQGNYRTRFCYPDHHSALVALQAFDGLGDPAGLWIKEKGLGGDRDNPLTFKGVPIVERPKKNRP